MGSARFRDHENYDETVLDEIGAKARAATAAAVVTTQKDAVKWGTGPAGAPPSFALSVRIVFTEGEEEVRDRLRHALRGS